MTSHAIPALVRKRCKVNPHGPASPQHRTVARLAFRVTNRPMLGRSAASACTASSELPARAPQPPPTARADRMQSSL
jgi:hypothetical protein